MSATVSQSAIQYRGNTTSGSYYFCIEGLPKRYTWQNLKDLVRKEAAHGIWTEMAFFANGQTGEIGWARVQRKDEAGKLFAFLANNLVQDRRLRIHLFDTSISPPHLLQHTCGNGPCILNTRYAEASRLAANPSASQPVAPNAAYVRRSPGYAVQPPSPYTLSPAAMPASSAPRMAPAYSMQTLEAGMANMRTSPAVDPAVLAATNRARLQQAYAQQMIAQQMADQAQAQAQAQGPVYVSSPTGTQVNVSQGAIKTEVRGIFVSQIDFKASAKDLQRYFGRAGEIVKCQLQKDPATGKSKGNATVQYAVASDAKKAVTLFNEQKFMGMVLKVRLDKEPVAVGASSASSSRTNGKASTSRSAQQSRNNAEPIIVNGSVCQK